jgi:glycosyltransferase involved in cell wall biosynthesis
MAATGIVRRVRPDVIHANGLRAGLIAAVPARLTAPPVLVQVHDVLPRSPLARAVRGAIGATADAISAVSEKAAARFNEGLSTPRAFCTHISIDHQRFDPRVVESTSIRSELGIADSPLLAQIAQITPWKGQHIAIEVLARLREQMTSAQLAIVGRVSFESARYDNLGYERELHLLADRLGVAGSVHFLGQRDDVPGLMKTSDLTLLPSTDEPFGTAALESMAMGTPPMVSADGGMSEFVEDRVSGRVLFRERLDEWAAAALELLNDRAALDRMGTEAMRAAAPFTDARYADEIESIYLRLCAERDGAGRRQLPIDGGAGPAS